MGEPKTVRMVENPAERKLIFDFFFVTQDQPPFRKPSGIHPDLPQARYLSAQKTLCFHRNRLETCYCLSIVENEQIWRGCWFNEEFSELVIQSTPIDLKNV